MPNETTKAVAPSTREFVIPLGLLKTFANDVRTIPAVTPNNGYIIFDKEMLISVLTGKDVEKRTELAKQLQNMGKAGGELIIMQR